ncbi:hypothetical protein DF048_01575 [Burkholderia seminalis]|nr:hypothetical protein DF048_01575 [Burkholderia seminalis]
MADAGFNSDANDSIGQAENNGQLAEATKGLQDESMSTWGGAAVAGYDAAQQGLSLGQAETANLGSFQSSPIGFAAGYAVGAAAHGLGIGGGGHNH